MNTAVQQPEDWHRADIKAALAKRGWTFNRIAREYGYARTSPSAVLWRRWRAIERLVAELLGLPPEVIWPSRYTDATARPVRSAEDRRSGGERRATLVKGRGHRKGETEATR